MISDINEPPIGVYLAGEPIEGKKNDLESNLIVTIYSLSQSTVNSESATGTSGVEW